MLSAPQAGLLREVLVEPFQQVEAGQPLLLFQPVEPRAGLDFLQSELQIARLRLEPALADRNALSFEQIRLELLRQRQKLAFTKVSLKRAESVLQRNEALRKDGLVSEAEYEISALDCDLFNTQVAEITSTIAQIENRLEELRTIGEPHSPGTNSKALEIVARLEDRLTGAQSGWKPVMLFAPISGMVHTIYRQTGESVVEGEPLITIHSPQADRIVAYLRQPYRFMPKPGLRVEVVTQNPPRSRFRTEIVQVGVQIEPITNALAILQAGKLVDAGLQLVLPVPQGFSIRPGEIVNVQMSTFSLADFFRKPVEPDLD